VIARAILGVLAAVFIAAKLFTAEVSLRDDPTSMLVLRRAPSLESRFHALPDGATVLAADENGFVGDGAWRWVTGIGWILFPAAWIAIEAGSRVRRSTR
jgi:hypothetical protein